jgi:hypothetical protein
MTPQVINAKSNTDQRRPYERSDQQHAGKHWANRIS